MALTKPKILINDIDRVTFHHKYLHPFIEQYFDIVTYLEGADYLAQDYMIMTHSGFNNTWYNGLVEQGAKLIYDAFWEYHVAAELTNQHAGSAFVASSKHYFWINEYYVHCQAGYNSYQPCRRPTHLALMPVRQSKPHRQQLLTALDSQLDRILYSQVDQGKYLPNSQTRSFNDMDQRYFNPEWYDTTYFSIVSETTTYSKYSLHITEKTYKPMAYRHPFVIFGQTGTLAYLHKLGFETFENLFDESYDTVEDQDSRLAMIVDNVKNFKETQYDAVTLAKLEHNYNLFYNADLVKQLVLDDIVTPILEYAET